jgi:hypothetical protein
MRMNTQWLQVILEPGHSGASTITRREMSLSGVSTAIANAVLLEPTVNC